MFIVTRLSHRNESSQDEAIVLMKNEIAKVSGEIKSFNHSILGRISSIDETMSSVKTQMNTLQRDVDCLHWRPRAQVVITGTETVSSLLIKHTGSETTHVQVHIFLNTIRFGVTA